MRVARRAVGGDGRADPRYGWVLVAALGATQIVSWGVLYYAFAVFLTPMQGELGLSTAEITGAFSLALGVSALAGLAVGRWLDRHSPRVPITAGSLLAALLVVAWSRVDSLAGLYLVFAGIGVAMATVLYEPAFIVITKWFSIRRRAALTALTLIAALASLIFSPLSERLIAALGWRDALVVLALVLASITVPLHAVFLRPAPPSPDRTDGGPRPGHAVGRSGHRRLPGFRVLTLSFVLATLATSSISVLLVTLLIADGHAPRFAALAAGIVGIAQIPGRLLFAAAAPWLSGSRLPTAVFGLMSLSLVLLAIDRSPMIVVGFAILFGMSAGMTTLTRAALIGELYGSERYGRNSSLVSAFVTAARAAAPIGAAAVAGLATDHVLLWTLAAAAAIAALAAARGVRQAAPVPGTA